MIAEFQLISVLRFDTLVEDLSSTYTADVGRDTPLTSVGMTDFIAYSVKASRHVLTVTVMSWPVGFETRMLKQQELPLEIVITASPIAKTIIVLHQLPITLSSGEVLRCGHWHKSLSSL